MYKRKFKDMMDLDLCETDNMDQREAKRKKTNTRTIACQTDARVYTEAEVHRILQHSNEQFEILTANKNITTARWVQ